MPYRNLKLACAEDSLSCWEGKCHISRRFKEENFNGSKRLKSLLKVFMCIKTDKAFLCDI